MSGAHPLIGNPLVHTAFEKLRKAGCSGTDGQTVRVEGVEYGITSNVVCRLELVHMVLERLDGPGVGHQMAMAVLEVKNNGYHGMDGASHVMPALISGTVVSDPMSAFQDHSYRVLYPVEVPHQFAPGCDGSNSGGGFDATVPAFQFQPGQDASHV